MKFKLDHIGIVVKDIKKSYNYYVKTFGFKKITKIIYEPAHKVKVQFINFGAGQMPVLELVMPIGKKSKVYNFLKYYHKNNFFVKIAKFNSWIGTGEVINTNFCKISVCNDRTNNKIIILSAIDNLIKGASGQAVQNMNIIYGFKEQEGLI